MSDLISRQAAIDALKVAYWDDNIQSAKDDPCIVDAMTDWAIRQVKALPSVQPETYKEKLKEIADALSEKFAYMNTCLNERDIILGYLGVKRPSITHCNTDCTNIKCESYCYNKRLPSAQPEINTDGDTISRRVAIDAIMSLVNFDTVKELRQYCDSHLAAVWSDGIRDAIDAIYDVGSTQPERKTGRWIYEERKHLVDETDDGPVYRTEKWWSCSECGYAKGYQISNPSSNYCENCGAKMLKDGDDIDS